MKLSLTILLLSATAAIAQPYYIHLNGVNYPIGDTLPRSTDGKVISVTNVPVPAFDPDTHIHAGHVESTDFTNGRPARVRFTPVIRALTADELESRRVQRIIQRATQALTELEVQRDAIADDGSPPTQAQSLAALRVVVDILHDVISYMRRKEAQGE